MKKANFIEWLRSIEGLLKALAALIGAIVLLVASISDPLASLFAQLGLPAWSTQAIAFGLLLLPLWVVWRSYRKFVKASRLEKPDYFSLSTSKQELLVGRDNDLEHLVTSVNRNRIVLLDGESGCGKSALVRVGLMPRLQKDEGLVPILIRDWGDDAVRGPLAAALEGLYQTLSPEQRDRIKWTGAPDYAADEASLRSELESRLDAVLELLGRRPLLIADQFDDYQAQNRKSFVDEQGAWIPPKTLVDTNPFWSLMRDKLVAGSLHLLAVTRADTASGLTCLMFLDNTDTKSCQLPRVKQDYLRPLLVALTPEKSDGPIVSNPDAGWTDLRERLEADIRERGAILMQQVQTALLGLRNLTTLTPKAYRRAGGLQGIESLAIASAIVRAGEAADMSSKDGENATRAVLLDLVLPGSANQQPKGRRRRLSSIEAIVKSAAATHAILRSLQADEIVRPSDTARSETAWQLDHDYLASAVLAEARQADRWNVILREGLARYRASHDGWRARWRKLLPITVQTRLFWERLRGRLRYGDAARYARLSLIKPVLAALLVATVCSVGYVWNEDRLLTERARVIENRLGGENQGEAVLAAWRAPEDLRMRLFELIEGDSSISGHQKITEWPLAHAGVEPERTMEVAIMLRERMTAEPDGEIASLLVEAYVTVSMRLFDPEELKSGAIALRKLLMVQQHDLSGKYFAEKYAAVAARLENQEELSAGALVLRELLTVEPDWQIANYLAEDYAAVAARLTDKAILTREAVALRETLTKEPDGERASSLAEAYAAIAVRLDSPEELTAGALALRDRLTMEPDWQVATNLVKYYAAVSARLTDNGLLTAEAVALRETMIAEPSVFSRRYFAEAYSAVASRLDNQEELNAGALALRERLTTETNNQIAIFFAEAYAAVGARLDNREELKAGALALRGRLTEESNERIARIYAEAYAVVAARIADPAIHKTEAVALRERLSDVPDDLSGSSLVEAYVAVAAQLENPEELTAGAHSLRKRLTVEPDGEIALFLAGAYVAVAAQLDAPEELKAGALGLRERLAAEPDEEIASFLAVAYAEVAAQLDDPEELKVAIAALQEKLTASTQWHTVSRLANAYIVVIARIVDPAILSAEALAMRERLTAAPDRVIASTLAEVYAAVAERLVDPAILTVEAITLRSKLTAEPDEEIASTLAAAYAAVAARLDDLEELKAGTAALREKLTASSDEVITTRLAIAYAAIVEQRLETPFTTGTISKEDRLLIAEVLTLSGHPYLEDPKDLLAILVASANQTFDGNTAAAVAWWVEEFDGDPATLRPSPIGAQ